MGGRETEREVGGTGDNVSLLCNSPRFHLLYSFAFGAQSFSSVLLSENIAKNMLSILILAISRTANFPLLRM